MENRTVNILGTEYKIKYVLAEELEGLCGTTDYYTKEICISKMNDSEELLHTDNIQGFIKAVLRHEIVHAFLYESGLDMQSGECESWANNETMIDWIALQTPKMFKVFQEVKALE